MSTTHANPTPISSSADLEGMGTGWPQLPTETEIYILPDGRVIVADLPVELADLVKHLGSTEAG